MLAKPNNAKKSASTIGKSLIASLNTILGPAERFSKFGGEGLTSDFNWGGEETLLLVSFVWGKNVGWGV